MEKKRSYIDRQKCQDCQVCPAAENCPTHSITREEEGEPLFVDITCIGCGKCVRNCHYNAIRLI